MKTLLCLRVPAVVILAMSSSLLVADQPTQLLFSGTVTNTTDPDRPVTGGLEIFLGADGGCLVRVGPPLYGSGICRLASFDQQTEQMVLVSESPLLRITWNTRPGDKKIVGEYEVTSVAQPSLPEHGTLELLNSSPGPPILLKDLLAVDKTKVGEAEYLTFRERDIVSFHRLDGSYAGVRAILDKADQPSLVIQDFKEGSKYLDPKTNAVVLEWVTDGQGGYFAQTKEQVTSYYDRFFKPLPWSSVMMADSKRVFLRATGDEVELFDDQLKPLNIRSSKTPSGRMCWLKREGEVTSLFDQNFKPLNWYVVERGGQTFYATFDKKHKVHAYDAQMRELRKPGFWSKLAYGMAVGLAAYGQALQQQSAARSYQYVPPAPQVYAPAYSTVGPGTNYSTTYQNRVGNITFSNTYSSTGTTTSMTTQHLGGMDFVNAQSSNGSWLMGSIQNIGTTHFGNFQTPAGSWMGSSQSVGGFMFHNFTGPQGQNLSGTSIRIGDFVFTQLQ